MIEILKEDIGKFLSLPTQFDFEKEFSVHILNAQRLDLKNLLGLDFYNDIIINLEASTIPPEYTKLLDGATYTNDKGNPIKYEGLKPIISNFAIARYIGERSRTATRTTIVRKKNKESEILKANEFEVMSQRYRTLANSYASELDKYLETEEIKELFPVYQQRIRDKVTSRIRIHSSKRSANRDGYGNDIEVILRPLNEI